MRLIQAEKEHAELLVPMETLYMQAFPAVERKPFQRMVKKQQEGVMQMWAVLEEQEFIGLAITVLYRDLVLLDYFAIAAKKRGTGCGSQVLSILKEKYQDKRFFLEIESTREPLSLIGESEAANRSRRKSFYLKNGMQETNLNVNIFTVEMEVLTAGKDVTFEEYYNLYLDTFGQKIADHVRKSRNAEIQE